MKPDWISAKEFCELVGITRAGLHSRIARGQIVPVYPPAGERGPTNSKPLRFDRADVSRFPRQRRAMRRFDDPIDWTPLDLAYLAGIIDGEGCISILRHARTTHYDVRLGIVNTSTDLIVWINDTFGPGVLHVKPKQVAHWKTSYEWCIGSISAYLILKSVLPMLRVKSKQAQIAMRFVELVHSKSCQQQRVSEQHLAEREKLRLELISLNGRQRCQP